MIQEMLDCRLYVAALAVATGLGFEPGGQICAAAEKAPAEAGTSAQPPSSVRLVRVGQIPGKRDDPSFEVAVQGKYGFMHCPHPTWPGLSETGIRVSERRDHVSVQNPSTGRETGNGRLPMPLLYLVPAIAIVLLEAFLV